MDKNRRNTKRKIKSICVITALCFSLFTYETVYASGEVLDVANNSHTIEAMTKNNGPAKSYDIQVAWGDMQFVYDYAVPKWDTEALEYEQTGIEGWDEAGLDGVNNKLQVSNRSNAEITVDLAIIINDGVFNDESAENKVQAHFYDTNENAKAASKILEDLESATFAGKIDKLVLESAEPVMDNEGNITKEAGVRTKEAYFAFSGTPDKNLNSSTVVGSISLVFTDTSDIDD